MAQIEFLNSISIVDNRDSKNIITYVVLPHHETYNLALKYINTRANALKKLVEYKYTDEWNTELTHLDIVSKTIYDILIEQLQNAKQSQYLIKRAH
jgi:hypothetical protein